MHHTGGMVSFSSSLHVDVEAGIAAFASSNVGGGLNYRPRDVTLHACELFKAVREGSPAPEPKATRPSVEHAERYVGIFTASDGDRFEVRAAGDQLKLRRGGRETDMQSAGGAFACAEPAFGVSGLVFDLENDRAVRAWADDREYLVDPSHGYKPPALTPLGDGVWRYGGDEWSPERVRFDGVVDGRPTRMLFSGNEFQRRFS